MVLQLLVERGHEDAEAVLAAVALDERFHASAIREAFVNGRHALIAIAYQRDRPCLAPLCGWYRTALGVMPTASAIFEKFIPSDRRRRIVSTASGVIGRAGDLGFNDARRSRMEFAFRLNNSPRRLA